MSSFRDKNGVLMVDDMTAIQNIVSLPPNAFTHTAAAGHVLAVGRIQSGERVCLVALHSPTHFVWVEYKDGADVYDVTEAAMNPGFLMPRLGI